MKNELHEFVTLGEIQGVANPTRSKGVERFMVRVALPNRLRALVTEPLEEWLSFSASVLENKIRLIVFPVFFILTSR